MQFVMFTKHLEGKDVAGIIECLKSVGVEGADLCVRPGYPVNPENAPTELPAAAKRFADGGLSIPMITTPGDFTDPAIDYTESLLAACQEAGVGLIKLGYWHMGEDGYWATVDRVRKNLEGFEKLCEKHGVKVCIHNHSGSSMGLNSCSLMNLVEGFNPEYIGAFADTGHLSIVGEPLPMAVDIVKDYLSIFAFKDLLRECIVQDGKRVWRIRVVPLGMGYVEWETIVKLLTDMDFAGPVSMHSEYSGFPMESVVDQARMDLRFIKGLMAEMS